LVFGSSSQAWTSLVMALLSTSVLSLSQTGVVLLISVLPLAAPNVGIVFQVTPPVEGSP
jgi:hypothetical protein